MWVAGTAAVLLAVPATAGAAGRPAPLRAVQATEVGPSAETNSINGIYVSPVDDNVYAASVGGDEITIHDPTNGKVIDRLTREDDGVNGPDDLFIADDGTIFWTEILLGRVGRLTPDGQTSYQEVGPGANPITMSDDGRLFVNRIFLGEGLYELDPDFVDPPRLIDPDLVVNGFDFGPDGHLYAPEFFTGNVLKIDVGVSPPTVEVVASGLPAPVSAVKFNSLGEPHVVSLGEGQVRKLDLVGGDHEVVLDIEGTIDNIAFDSRDRLFAAAGVDNQLVRVDGKTTKVLGRPGYGGPGGVAVSPDGTVWVSELFALRGTGSNPTRWSQSFYDTFPAPFVFAGSTTVQADDDDLLITSAFSSSVQVLDPATGAISFDERIEGVTNAVRHDGRIVATQLFSGVVDAVTGDQVLGGLFVPLGMASSGDTLYVGDWATGIVWAVDDTGAAPIATGLSAPEGMAVDGDRLLVVESDAQRVIAIDLATGAQSEVVVGLDFTTSSENPLGFFPFGAMSDVAVGPDGSLYVSEDGTNRVLRFRAPQNGR